MINTILYFIVMALVMLGLARLLPGFEVRSFGSALIASVVLALANAILKPILFLLTLPLTLLTLGLFLLVLNALMLWVTAKLVPGFAVHGWMTTLVASLVLSVVGTLWKAAVRSK